MADFTLHGVGPAHDHLLSIARQFPEALAEALRVEAERVMTTAKEDYVPVHLGTLYRSGTVHPVERDGNSVSVTLSFGDAASPYALAVHEHPSASSPPSWQVAEAEGRPVQFHPVDATHGPKYLERPLRAAVAGMEERLVEQANKGLT